MKRIQEKVKDLIEVRPYEVLYDFISNPAQTLSVYHFTDVTSDLMSQWLDRVVSVDIGNGASNALAGYRGVGKSHFLATLGAIISQPELRSRISDAHVAASAQRLKRRRYPVAYVRRGISDSFIDELRTAIAKVLEIDIAPTEALADLLNLAAQKAEDVPFVIIIDTAFERASRVSRDDGAILSEIAEITKNLNVFVAVALDDDIAGADGANASISRTYTIDYLDQEHLYKIVNNYIFPKHRQALPLLHDIYNDFRKILPSFRWSEQRFVSLYPLHPVTLEIAPYVRLYAQDFALLSFISGAGKKILGRPANSLIALDEVFDDVENSLRKVKDLNEAFAAYDKINSEVVANIPIMQRMQAKLILKGLLLLSLDGYGTTVNEISSAMLIFDEDDPDKSSKSVQNLLETFVTAFPESIERTEGEGRDLRFSLKIGNKEDLNNALGEAIKNVPGGVIPKILRRIGRDRFPEWILPGDDDAQNNDSTDSSVVWRGSLRRGRIVWDLESNTSKERPNAELYDWEIVINPNNLPENELSEISRVQWRPAPLKRDEAETILRYFVLLTNTQLRDEYGEFWQAAGHTHTLVVEKIWNRLFLQDAKFVIDGSEYDISEEAFASLNLSDMLSKMLEPLFEVRYPGHPFFTEPLAMNEVSALVNDFFSGAKQNVAETQRLAETFALPLGLVVRRGDSYIPETEENIINLPVSQEVLSLVNESSEEMISLKKVNQKLRQLPFGLMREAQHLVLTALVAQRQIEFVTSKGNRINRRSLDLKIIWDDIVGITKPTEIIYGSKHLTEWAQILTGENSFQSIDIPEDQKTIKKAFETWLEKWNQRRTLERFNEFPDEVFNTKIWRLATNIQKTFEVAATTINDVLANTISLEEGLHRIADAFSDSREFFKSCTNDLIVLEDFINSASKRREIWTYLTVCGATEDKELELLRTRLLRVIDNIYYNPDKTLHSEMSDLWEQFHARFTEHFKINHDAVMKSHILQEKYDEIKRGDDWWEFENLSTIAAFPQNFWNEAKEISEQFRELNCRFNVKEMLETHPFCACSFNLTQADEWEKLPETLQEKVARGREVYRQVLRSLSRDLIPLIKDFARKNQAEEFTESVQNLVWILEENKQIPLLKNNELIILRKVFAFLPMSAFAEMRVSDEVNFLEKGDILPLIDDWMIEIPGDPQLLKI